MHTFPPNPLFFIAYIAFREYPDAYESLSMSTHFMSGEDSMTVTRASSVRVCAPSPPGAQRRRVE